MPMNGDSFADRVGELYLRLRGSGLTLSFLDLERIRSWQERGVPVQLAEEALHLGHAAWVGGGRSNRARPFPLGWAEAPLEKLLAGERNRYGGPSWYEAVEPSTERVPGDYAPAPTPPPSNPDEIGTSLAKMNETFDPLSHPLKELLQEIHHQLDRRGLEPDPIPPPSCHSCHGRGFRIVAEGAVAQARPCDCERLCQQCRGKGFLLAERDGYQFSRPCQCQTLTRRIAAYNATQLPARFWNKGFDNFYVEAKDPKSILDAKNALQDFARGVAPGKLGMGLLGGPGRGKTHLLAATLATLSLGRGVSCRYVEISFLFADMKAAISDPRARATVDKIDELAEVEVLAIDELGKGRGSVFEEEVLDELIGRRYNNEKPTLFATNYPLEDQKGDPLGQSLRSRVGERIFSRLHEMVVFLELPKKADDHRLLLRKMMR